MLVLHIRSRNCPGTKAHSSPDIDTKDPELGDALGHLEGTVSPQQVIQCWLGFDLIHQDVGGSLRAVFDLLQNLPELFTVEVVPWQTKAAHQALPEQQKPLVPAVWPWQLK